MGNPQGEISLTPSIYGEDIWLKEVIRLDEPSDVRVRLIEKSIKDNGESNYLYDEIPTEPK